eukprot:2445984-Rhodomonas_salina.1
MHLQSSARSSPKSILRQWAFMLLATCPDRKTSGSMPSWTWPRTQKHRYGDRVRGEVCRAAGGAAWVGGGKGEARKGETWLEAGPTGGEGRHIRNLEVQSAPLFGSFAISCGAFWLDSEATFGGNWDGFCMPRPLRQVACHPAVLHDPGGTMRANKVRRVCATSPDFGLGLLTTCVTAT